MTGNASLIVPRWHALAAANRLRQIVRGHKLDLMVMLLGGLVVGAYLTEALYLYVVRHAALLRSAWPVAGLWGLGVSAVLGFGAGWGAARLGLRAAFATWIAALPIPLASRVRTAAVASLILGTAEAAMWGIAAAIVCWWIGVEHPGIDASTAALVFLSSFTATLIAYLWVISRRGLCDRRSRDAIVLMRVRNVMDPAQPPSWSKGLFDLLAPLDQFVPKWIGRWVMDNGVLRRAAGEIGVLLCVALLVGAASLVQGQAVPALAVGTLVAHVGFVITMRSHPLASVVLRCSPLNFARAWAGVVRLPCVVSFVYFVPLALVGLVANPAQWSITIACAAALVVVNGTYAVISANAPLFPKATRIAHAVLLMLTFKGAIEINGWVVLPLAAFILLTWRSAVRRYRIYG